MADPVFILKNESLVARIGHPANVNIYIYKYI